MPNEVLVSVIIPAWNAEKFLAATLQSLVSQTYEVWEAIVVDDGSTDGTAELVSRWALTDRRIRLLKQANGGVSLARNCGIAQAEGRFIAFLDADDMWHPEKLRTQVKTFSDPSLDVVFCSSFDMDTHGKTFSPTEWCQPGVYDGRSFFVLSVDGFFLLPSAAMIRKEVLQANGSFDPELRSSEDWDLWLRLAQAGCNFCSQPERHLYYRRRPDSLSVSADFESYRKIYSRIWLSPWITKAQRRKPVRLHFRNSLTRLRNHGRTHEAKRLLQAYCVYDPDGNSCRILTFAASLLPTGAFWAFARYVIIPLSWHFERLGERLGRLRARAHRPAG